MISVATGSSRFYAFQALIFVIGRISVAISPVIEYSVDIHKHIWGVVMRTIRWWYPIMLVLAGLIACLGASQAEHRHSSANANVRQIQQQPEALREVVIGRRFTATEMRNLS